MKEPTCTEGMRTQWNADGGLLALSDMGTRIDEEHEHEDLDQTDLAYGRGARVVLPVPWYRGGTVAGTLVQGVQF
jgi:hypothetical protein